MFSRLQHPVASHSPHHHKPLGGGEIVVQLVGQWCRLWVLVLTKSSPLGLSPIPRHPLVRVCEPGEVSRQNLENNMIQY